MKWIPPDVCPGVLCICSKNVGKCRKSRQIVEKWKEMEKL